MATRNYSDKIVNLQRKAIESQKGTFTRWINENLKNRKPVIQIKNDLFEEITDGTILLALLESFTHESFRAEGSNSNRSKINRIHSMNNLNNVFNYLTARGIQLHGINKEGILDGKPQVVLALLWKFIHHKHRLSDKSITGIFQSDKKHKKRLLNWATERINKSTSKVPFKNEFKNFGKNWADAKNFLNLIHALDNNALPKDIQSIYQKQNNKQNLQLSFDIAEQRLGIPQLLVPEGKLLKIGYIF